MRARLAQGSAPLSDFEAYREIADALSVSVADVELMDARLAGADSSLNAPLGDSVSERLALLASDSLPPDELAAATLDEQRRADWLREALRVLSERELKIIRDRRLNEEGATLESLGRTLGISKERVRQIEHRAIEKLRLALSRRDLAFGATLA